MGASASCEQGMEGGRRTSSRAHALCNPLSTKKRVARALGGEGLLPDTLLVHIASFSVAPHAVDWRTLLALRGVSVSVSAALICEDAAPVLWRRLVRPPTDAALLLGARGAGFGGPTHADLSGCAALTDAALLAALRGSSRLRVLNVSGHFYGGECIDEGFKPPEPPFTASAVDAVLASLAQPAGQPCHTPLHLITNESKRWMQMQCVVDERSSACRTELGAPCQSCQIDMIEECGPDWGPCDMCDKHLCGEYGERSEGCIPVRTCTVCGGTFCAECDPKHAPNKSPWGYHSCDECIDCACRSCVFWPSCDECDKTLCLACDSGDFVVCTACNSMWCHPCADEKYVGTCDMCDSAWCSGCEKLYGCACV